MGCLFEERIQVLGIHIAATCCATLVVGWLWQFHRLNRTRLLLDKLIDALNLWRINKGTLHTYRLLTVEIEHITTTNQLVGSGAVEDGLRVDG